MFFIDKIRESYYLVAPQLYHLRDSGAIEQDADIVLMLEQVKNEIIESNGTRHPGRPDINIWVRKNRNFQKDVKIVVQPNDSYSAFHEVPQGNEVVPTTVPAAIPATTEDNTNDLPF